MTEVAVGSGGDRLVLRADGRGPIAQIVVARLESDGLLATRTVHHGYDSGFADLEVFFDRLVADWRGWAGVRSWESLESDLAIEARHAHGHVQLRVALRARRPGWGNDGWVATPHLTVDPGEELSQIAADLRGLSSGPEEFLDFH